MWWDSMMLNVEVGRFGVVVLLIVKWVLMLSCWVLVVVCFIIVGVMLILDMWWFLVVSSVESDFVL